MAGCGGLRTVDEGAERALLAGGVAEPARSSVLRHPRDERLVGCSEFRCGTHTEDLAGSAPNDKHLAQTARLA